MNVSDLDTPALVVDIDQVERNIEEMAQRAREGGVRLRPHTKTHKMPEIAQLQVDAGAAGITCAKVGEAEVMVASGFDDVLIAYPIYGPTKLARLTPLREKARIIVSLDSVEVARGLGQLGVSSGDPVEIYVEIDTGQHRMGRLPGEPSVQLIREIAEIQGVTILGLIMHAGHAYGAASVEERDALIDREVSDLVATKEMCAAVGIPIREISVGSTPGARSELRHDAVTEVRPGTYVFNDTTMMSLGVATEEMCAARILATVVARPSDDRFVIDAGTKSLTSDGAGRPGWIRVVGREDLTMSFTSEEHGVGTIDLGQGGRLAIGDTLELIPSHVCPVVNLFDMAYAIRGDEVVGELRVEGRGKVR